MDYHESFLTEAERCLQTAVETDVIVFFQDMGAFTMCPLAGYEQFIETPSRMSMQLCARRAIGSAMAPCASSCRCWWNGGPAPNWRSSPRHSPGRLSRLTGIAGESPIQGREHLAKLRVLERGHMKGMLTAMDVQAITAPLGILQRGPDLL